MIKQRKEQISLSVWYETMEILNSIFQL